MRPMQSPTANPAPEMKNKTLLASFAFAALAIFPHAAAKDGIQIVGSSTVYPFSAVVAERFGRETAFPAPRIEATGSGGGMKLFCAGTDDERPDITNSSRRITRSERELCAGNGVAEIVEVKIGYDGIVLAQSVEGRPMDITRPQIFLALARHIPDGAGGVKENDNQKWSDISPELPDADIRVYGPPPTSGTRDAFAELALEGGCDTFPELAALKESDRKRHRQICRGVREDGAYIESGENDNLIVQKLSVNPDSFGVFGFSFLEENADKVRGANIDGVEPTFEAIADFSYAVSRPLFFYAKKARIGKTAGLREFMQFFADENATGEDGYLSERGLIPLDEKERAEMRATVEQMTPLEAP